MKYNPDIHHRRSIRLKGYDYSQSGAYFVTICVHDRECLFGEIVDGEMRMKQFGHIVAAEWIRSAEIRAEIELGEFVVMPNHFHGIVHITTQPVGAYGHTPVPDMPVRSPSKTIGAMVRGFKSAVTTRINETRNSHGLPVWQRNYHEHIIRDDADYNRIAEYVAYNPQRWVEDKLHPDNFVDVENVVQKTVMGGDGNIVGAYGHTPGSRCENPKSGECHSPLRNPQHGGRNE